MTAYYGLNYFLCCSVAHKFMELIILDVLLPGPECMLGGGMASDLSQ